MDVAWIALHFNTFKNIAHLDSGGQKFVFTAECPQNGLVVLKLFKPEVRLVRAEREITAVQMIASPRIPKIFDQGSIAFPLGGQITWITEQKIDGVALSSRIRAGSISDVQILRIGLHVLQALAAAEKCKIVHRDVKPANIMLGNNGDGWLLDFGLARHLDLTSVTPSGQATGACTPGYGPREQFRNKKREIDARADLFALGVTLYECVERRNPFIDGARDHLEMFRRVERTSLPVLSRDIDKSGEFKELVLALTRPVRAQRPKTVAEALIWMEQICASEGVN